MANMPNKTDTSNMVNTSNMTDLTHMSHMSTHTRIPNKMTDAEARESKRMANAADILLDAKGDSALQNKIRDDIGLHKDKDINDLAKQKPEAPANEDEIAGEWHDVKK